MSILDENSPVNGLLLCLTLAMLIVLIWYIRTQEYTSACDRRIMDLQYRSHVRGGDYKPRELSVVQDINSGKEKGTMLEQHKKVIEPEKTVMTEHFMGDDLHDTRSKMDDPLSLDGLLVKSRETTSEQLFRNVVDASHDGPQLEGMWSPISAFEEDALSRQLSKAQDIYGIQVFTDADADKLSQLNM